MLYCSVWRGRFHACITAVFTIAHSYSVLMKPIDTCRTQLLTLHASIIPGITVFRCGDISILRSHDSCVRDLRLAGCNLDSAFSFTNNQRSTSPTLPLRYLTSTSTPTQSKPIHHPRLTPHHNGSPSPHHHPARPLLPTHHRLRANNSPPTCLAQRAKLPNQQTDDGGYGCLTEEADWGVSGIVSSCLQKERRE